MNGRNDERELEDDGFYTVEFGPLPAPLDSGCLAAPEKGGAGVLLLSGVLPTDRAGLDPEADQILLQSDGEECRDATCEKCLGTGYRRDWRGTRVMCDDCWSDNGDY